MPLLTIVSDEIINNSNQLDRKYKDLANHNVVDSLVISPLFSKTPIQIEDPGGGGIPSNPYDMYYVKQTVNHTLLYTGNGVRVGILETAWGTDYAMVDPSIQNFKSGCVMHDSNINYTDYNTHATTVAAISSGHYGIAKNSLIYSTSFKESGSNPYMLSKALSWLNQESNISQEKINVDVINMSFSGLEEIDILRSYPYLYRKIMIAGSGNKHLKPIGYPAAYANVFTVGATTPVGDAFGIT